MADRFDVLYPQDYERKDGSRGTNWHRIGNGFSNDKGDITIMVAVLPVAPGPNGDYKFIIRQQQPRDGSQPRGFQKRDNDDIPF